MELTIGDRNTLLSTARMTLQAFVKTRRLPDLVLRSSGAVQPAGAFVTLYCLGQMRGCVGTLEEKPLYRNVMELTASAASEDPRFAPIGPEELHQVRIEIAVLGTLEPLHNADEIRLGQTGLAIRGDPPTILLPEAASLYGATPEAFLTTLCSHAGLKADAWRLNVPVWRFTTDTFSEED